ncbi:MAG: lipopolysaccharide assembly protein LapB [Hydromonas sp.]|nr:lipopolysaccharide assembly protein LapB [Hydromonas sp.]
MEFEIEWLLVLPLFFALGWLAAQWDSRKRAQESKKLPKSYFQGLNHLLDQEPDKAIEALIDVTRVDTGTVDLYFALGHLFTQRGEVERGIRVYQSLIDRPDLSEAPRLSATFKLGNAFLSGGLFDRAEQCFIQLIGTPHEVEARQQLIHIYQSQQEWQQAISMVQALKDGMQPELVQVSNVPIVDKHNSQALMLSLSLVHFHCELALEAMRRQDWAVAETEIQAALSERPNSIRAQSLRGQWYAQQQRHAEALGVWQGLAQAQSEAIPLLVNDMMKSYAGLNRSAEGVEYLYQQALDTGSIDVLDAWLIAQNQYGDGTQSLSRLDQLFTRHPSLNALNQLLNARIKEEEVGTEDERAKAALIRGLIQNQVKQLSRYRCTHCGFEAAHYYWQCPACTRWETYPPKRLEEIQHIKRSRNNPNNY